MATTKKALEVKEEATENTEVVETFEKESIGSKVKAKADAGKSWISRNRKKVAIAAGAGAAAIGLGIAAKLAGGSLPLGGSGFDSDGFAGTDDGAPFDTAGDAE